MSFYELLEKYGSKARDKDAMNNTDADKKKHEHKKMFVKEEEAKAPETPKEYKKPYIDSKGDLVIPFDSDLKYHWWAGGQSIIQTLHELGAPEMIKKYRENRRRFKIPVKKPCKMNTDVLGMYCWKAADYGENITRK